ncbi:MAG: BatD family protein [Lentisphaeria bacterium]|nr:BatD family protein [Lentisphaeria bacterium]
MMKKFLLAIFLLPVILLAEKLTVETIFRPAVVTAGEPVEITVISNKRGELVLDLPQVEGARWLRNYVSSSTQTSIVNGVVSVSVRRTIPLLTEKPGVLTIPSFTVKCGKETASTRELVIKVTAAGDGSPAAAAVAPPWGEIRLPSKGKNFYTGEEIPLLLSLFIPVGTEVRELSYPELAGLGSAVLTDYSKVNPRNRFFAPPVERRRVIGNQEVIEMVFQTSFRALKPETVTPQASAQAGIVYRTQKRTPRSMFDDDFFDGFFSSSSARVIPRRIDFKFMGNPIRIQALPPLTAASHFLNLTGSWQLSVRLGSTTARVGEPVELVVTLLGEGSGEALTAPALQIPGFRVYPPEVKKYPGRIEIKYALIPLETGERKFAPSFAVFDPVAGKYVISNKELVLPVSPGSAPAPAAVAASPLPEKKKALPLEEEKNKPAPVRSELFYQKSSPGRAVELPLMRNAGFALPVILIPGVIAALGLYLRRRNRERAQNDAFFRRKQELHHQLKEVMNQLKESGYSADKIRETAVPFLAESLGLAPGTTPEELAEHISDQTLRDWLNTLNDAGFMPRGVPADNSATPERVRSLLKALKRYGIILLLLGTTASFGSFNTAFDKRDYAAAEKEYKKFITRESWAPGALYNLAGVYYMKNDLPRARLYFLRALLVAPRDVETLENLNLVNRKLMQSETGGASTPGELVIWCRDRLRPDQHLTCAAVCLVLLLLLAAWRLRSSAGVWCGAGLAVLAAVFILCAAFQAAGPYNARNVIVTAPSVKLHSLPVESSKVDATLPGGGSGIVVENRGPWCRIKINGQDGWVRTSDIETIFPGGIW